VSLTLAELAGTTSGFDGQGTSWPAALLSSDPNNGPLTISGLTFKNAVASSGDLRGSALLLGLTEGLTLSNDTFENDQNAELGPVFIYEYDCSNAPVTISDSTFKNNSMTMDGSYDYDKGGAGLSLELDCSDEPVTLSGNTFSTNSINLASGHANAGGAGLALFGSSSTQVPVTQSDNVFDSNTIIGAPGGSSLIGGGGEWAGEVDLTSTGDKFTNNVIPGEGGDGTAAGAGLALGEDLSCDEVYSQATLVDDAVANNTIAMQDAPASDQPSVADGAGIAVTSDSLSNCEEGPRINAAAGPADTADLNLNDSSVVDNGVTNDGAVETDGGATSGIFGSYGATLEFDNTIAYGNVGGLDVGGFLHVVKGPLGGGVSPLSNVVANYSDLCNADGTPYTGPGNICADPNLADDSYTPPSETGGARIIDGTLNGPAGSSVNVSETSSSPTLDAGSNSLVPSGITTDIYGNTRELSKSCPVGAGTVDIGAAEYVPTCTVSTPPPASTPTPITPAPTPLPSKKVAPCMSRRAFLVHMHFQFRIPAGVSLLNVQARLTSKTVANFGMKSLPAFGPGLELVRLDLKKYPYGTYKLALHITESTGRHVSTHDVYHTCRVHPIHYPPHPLPSILAG